MSLRVAGLLTNTNYVIDNRLAGLWTVDRAALTVAADPQSRLFSEADPLLTYRITSGRLFNGDGFSGELARETGTAPGFYAITQLFLFREGRRSNEAMTAVARTLKDDDLRGFAAVIDALPAVAPAPEPTPPDAARMSKGRELARLHKCVFCHGDDLSGGQQVPRIGGQREEYLRESLRGFKSGQRPGYTQAMIEAVSQVPVEDLDTLAYYAARVPLTAAAGAPASAPPGAAVKR